MNVPLLDLEAQYAGIRAELEEAALRALRSQRYILGPEVEAFESELAAYLSQKALLLIFGLVTQ